MKNLFFYLFTLVLFSSSALASGEGDGHWHLEECGGDHSTVYDPSGTALHHISDANIYEITYFIGKMKIPLPCILKSDEGWAVFMSSKFAPIDNHGNGQHTYKGYALVGGSVKKIMSESAVKDHAAISCYTEKHYEKDGKDKTAMYLNVDGKSFPIDSKTTYDGGLAGGGPTSFLDFSITKNVVTMFLGALLLGWLFIGMANKYKRREGEAPSGIQGLLEPMFLFIQNDVAKPMIGAKYAKFTPYLMAIFFFILVLNLLGQIPFIGNPNVTGNIGFTIVLAIITFIITNINGNKDYWKHILWMPGIPWWVKLILTPIEIIGLLLKPFTLFVRLFANITAGHIVILSFVGLIFILGKSGESMGGVIGGGITSVLLTLFMMCIELLVAFIQAFIFTILSASYIGAAVEEHHHDDH